MKPNVAPATGPLSKLALLLTLVIWGALPSPSAFASYCAALKIENNPPGTSYQQFTGDYDVVDCKCSSDVQCPARVSILKNGETWEIRSSSSDSVVSLAPDEPIVSSTPNGFYVCRDEETSYSSWIFTLSFSREGAAGNLFNYGWTSNSHFREEEGDPVAIVNSCDMKLRSAGG
jgi:hypothetical protein